MAFSLSAMSTMMELSTVVLFRFCYIDSSSQKPTAMPSGGFKHYVEDGPAGKSVCTGNRFFFGIVTDSQERYHRKPCCHRRQILYEIPEENAGFGYGPDKERQRPDSFFVPAIKRPMRILPVALFG
jgi:hypothetical protein